MDSLLRKLFMMEADEVLDYLFLKAGGYRNDGYWYRPGTGHMLLQAHADTVRKQAAPRTFHEHNGVVSTDGILGADDRAGVYALMEFIKNPEVSLLCTDQEEVGGIGMKKFLVEGFEMPHINLAIALDRQGVGEYVVYNNINEKVYKYVETFGYHENVGSFSDIMLFTDHYKIPSVNLSVGYYNQHTADEFLCIDELRLTIDRVKRMIRQPLEVCYPVEKFAKAQRRMYDYDDYFYWERPEARTGRRGLSWNDDNRYADMDNDERFEDIYGDVRPLTFEEKYEGGEAELCDLCNSPAEYITEEGSFLCKDCLMYLQGGESMDIQEATFTKTEGAQQTALLQ